MQNQPYITQQELDAILTGLRIGLWVVGFLLTAICGLLVFIWQSFNTKLDALAEKVDQAAAHGVRIANNEVEINKLREHYHDLTNKLNRSFAMLTGLETWREEHTRFAEAAEARLEERLKALEARLLVHEQKE